MGNEISQQTFSRSTKQRPKVVQDSRIQAF